MKVLIIEDEPLASDQLQKMLLQISPDSEVLGILDSVKSAVRWFKEHQQPDILLLDVQLADGLSFEIFEQVKLHVPVIFTTAYDEYALRAFRVNSIDYLLKPIDPDALKRALDKFSHTSSQQIEIQPSYDFQKLLSMVSPGYKKRFLIKVGEHLRFVDTSSVSYFVSMDKSTFLCTDGRVYGIDMSLDELEPLLDPARFYRANRKYIISVEAIADMLSWSGSRLMVKLRSPANEEILISREKVSSFKNWLDS
jgi:DNA-binding LytR/AlgR family response regulator